MHSNYQPITPASNKLLKKRWDGEAYNMHRKKVSKARCVVDNTAPPGYGHLQNKPKKIQVRHSTSLSLFCCIFDLTEYFSCIDQQTSDK